MNQTISFWFNGTIGARTHFYGNRDEGSGGIAGELQAYFRTDINRFICQFSYISGNAVTSYYEDSTIKSNSSWKMATCILNVSGSQICLSASIDATDGVKDCQTATYSIPAEKYTIGYSADNQNPMNGNYIDNLIHYNGAWSDADLIYMYNDGAGREFESEDTTPPSIETYDLGSAVGECSWPSGSCHRMS